MILKTGKTANYIKFLLLSLLSSLSYGDTLTIYQAIGSKEFRLDYTDGQGGYNKVININLVEGLVLRNANGDILPGQAKSWKISKNQRSISFKIRDDALWSNGDPVIAEDFVAAWRRLVDPNNKRRMNGLLFTVKNYKKVRSGKLPPSALGVRALNDKTLEVDLSGAPDIFLKSLSHHPVAPIYSRDKSRTPNNQTWQTTQGKLYNGPYVPARYNSTGKLEIVKNKHYYNKDLLGFDKVVWKRGLKNGEAISAVVSGKADQSISDEPSDMSWVSEYASGMRLEGTVPVIRYLVFHKSSKAARSPKIREAINIALFREKLNFKGDFKPINLMNTTSMYSQSSALPSPAWKAWSKEKRLNKARQLVQESGHSAQNPFVLKLLAIGTGGGSDNTPLANSITHQLSQIGISVFLEKTPLENYYRRLKEGDYSSAVIVWLKDFDDPLSHLGLLGSDHSYYANKFGTEEVNDLLDKASKIIDPVARESQYLKVESVNIQDNIIIPLLYTRQLRLAATDIENASAGYAQFDIRLMKRKAPAAEQDNQ